jgi:hypothetical protein
MIRRTSFLLLLVLPVSAQAGVIVGYNPFDPASHARYDRFTGGFPTAPVANTSPTFLGAGLDLSGVGWIASAPNFAVTMISPQHFLAAAHVGTGSAVQFVGAGGVVHTYSVASSTRLTTTFGSSTLPSDILIGTLSAPIPTADGVTSYAIAGLTEGAVTGLPLLAYGQNAGYATSPHLGTNVADGTALESFDGFNTEATRVIYYDFTPEVNGEIYLIGGDSGGPLFTLINGQLALIGGHYGVSNPTLNPNAGDISASTFAPAYLDELNRVTGGQIRVLAVPEPSTLAVGLALAGVLGIVRLKQRDRLILKTGRR